MLTVVLMITAVQAQETPQSKGSDVHRHDGQRNHHGGLAKLNLTEEQKTKLKSLNSEHQKQIADLKKQDNITVKESREKMEALRKDHIAKVQSLLTTEQKAMLEKNNDGKNRRMGGMERNRGERMKQELNLTSEQSAKLDASRKKL